MSRHAWLKERQKRTPSFGNQPKSRTAIEYSLIAGLIVIALLSALSSVAGANSNTYEMLERELIADQSASWQIKTGVRPAADKSHVAGQLANIGSPVGLG